MPQRTAFVTGGTGFLGLNLIEELSRHSWRVVALHRPSSRLKYLQEFPVELRVGDITDPPSLKRAIPRGSDAVFHVAGSTNLWSRRNEEQTRINVAGTRYVVAAALEAEAGRFVHTSSISAYGIHYGSIREDAEMLGGLSPINYQRSKFAAEQEVRRGMDRGLDAVIVNPAAVIGRYDTTGWARFIKMVHGGKLLGVPPGALSFCHASEVVKAHVAAVERGRAGQNYLLGGIDASFLEVIRVIAEVTGRRAPRRASPAWLVRLSGRVGEGISQLTGKAPNLTLDAAHMVTRRMFCDSSKAERDLGYKAVDLRTMIEDSYRWLKQEGLLEL